MAPKEAIAARLDGLRPVKGIEAVAPGDRAASSSAPDASIADEVGFVRRDAAAFEDAGWTFVRPETSGPAVGQSVVVDAGGHMKVVGRSLNVQLAPSVSKADARAILQENGLTVRRELGFAPNLFVVESPEADVLTKAKDLNALDVIEFAEPTLIEPSSHR